MLEFHTEEPQYGINASSAWFPTEYAGIPYWAASVWNQFIFNMISLLNMLEFHTEEHQYDTNESSVLWFNTEYAGIPYWAVSVWNQCNFNMIS